MPELCPLLRDVPISEGIPVDVPEECLRQCEAYMTQATRGEGYWDDYLRGEQIPDGEVEFSHDSVALASLINREARTYTVVDRVTMSDGGWIELGEMTYTFTCPHSSV